MPRKARKNIDGRYFHIMVQGIDKEFIFSDDDSKGYYLTSLQRAQEKVDVKIIAFCIMGTHAHILVVVNDAEELARYFKRVNSDYAMYYNRIRKRIGYVFRDRYRSELITTKEYMAYCLAYIQNNPVKAGIVERAEDYPYSSYTNYLTGRGIVDFKEAAKYFDTSPKSMKEIMSEMSPINWMEHKDREYEDKQEVLKRLLKKYHITSKESIKKQDLARKMALEIKERSGASIREIAEMLELGRETLRRWLSTPP